MWPLGSSSVKSLMLRGSSQVQLRAAMCTFLACLIMFGVAVKRIGEILAMANPWGTSQNPRFPGLLERGTGGMLKSGNGIKR